MKAMLLVGILLMVLGVVALAHRGVTYTTRGKMVELGPVHVTTEVQKTVPFRGPRSPQLVLTALHPMRGQG